MEKTVLSATDQHEHVNLSRNNARVEECIFPENVSCRGCSHSYRPDLYDGGCRLHYERIRQRRETAGEPNTATPKLIEKGGK